MCDTTINTEPLMPDARARARVRRRRWLSVLGGMAAANAVWGAAALADVELAVRQGGRTTLVSSTQVLAASLVIGLASWLLLEVLERWVRRPQLVWRTTACLLFVLSLTGPLTATSDSARATLLGLHVLVGGILLVGIGWSTALPPRYRDDTP